MSKYIRTDAAADYVGLSKSFLDKARIYGGGPAYSRLGRSIFYQLDDLDAWVAANRQMPANHNSSVGQGRAA